MTLKDRLLKDMRTAMKAKDFLRKDVLTMVRAALLQIEKDKRIELDDKGVLEVIAKEVKSRREAIELFKQGGRQDLVQKNEHEIEILTGYLPPQLSEQEVRDAVQRAIERTGAESMKDMGKVMSVLMQELRGSVDGGTVSKVVKEFLQ